MLLKISFLLFYSIIVRAENENCTDVDDRFVEHGLLYVPGPNLCTQCVCHHSEPKWCRTMFCNGPPIMCKNYSVGTTCCQFYCHDPLTEKPPLTLKELQNSGSCLQDWRFIFSILIAFSILSAFNVTC